MKRSFEVVAFRHGDKDGKELSAFGVQQVEASAHTHMRGTPFVLAFSSGMPRATRSCQIVLDILGQKLPVIADPNFPFCQWRLRSSPIEEWYSD